MNKTTTIRIFIKGLKDAQSLTAHIYEKGPQTLTDAISEVKKVHATQQLTAPLVASSKVNVMSHEEDHCFQCQESGHIACHCPNVCCFECDEYGQIEVDCPHQRPPMGTPACHHRHKSHTRHCTRSTSHHQDRYRCSRSRSQSHSHRHHSHSHHDSYRGHSRSHHRHHNHCHRNTSQCPHSSTYHSHHDTPHYRSSSHRSSSAYS